MGAYTAIKAAHRGAWFQGDAWAARRRRVMPLYWQGKTLRWFVTEETEDGERRFVIWRQSLATGEIDREGPSETIEAAYGYCAGQAGAALGLPG